MNVLTILTVINYSNKFCCRFVNKWIM